MLSGLAQQVHKFRFLLDAHSPTILTAVGVGGTVTTAVLTGRASFKAAELTSDSSRALRRLEMAKEGYGEEEIEDHVKPDLTKVDKVKLTWRLYLPPVAAGATTIGCIVAANRISSKRLAALVVAGGISERALQEYKDKVVDKLTDRQNQKVRDEIAQDRITNHSSGQELVLVGAGQVLCYDLTTDRYFQSTMEDIKRAENHINSELLHNMAASLAEFHDQIGLRPTTYTDSVGWGSPEMFKVVFSSVLSPDGRPCIAIDFERPPVLEYIQNHG